MAIEEIVIDECQFGRVMIGQSYRHVVDKYGEDVELDDSCPTWVNARIYHVGESMFHIECWVECEYTNNMGEFDITLDINDPNGLKAAFGNEHIGDGQGDESWEFGSADEIPVDKVVAHALTLLK